MGRASRIAKDAAKRGASAAGRGATGAAKRGASLAGRGAAGFAKQAVREGYEAATRETCPHCGRRSDTSTLTCPGCGRDKRDR